MEEKCFNGNQLIVKVYSIDYVYFGIFQSFYNDRLRHRISTWTGNNLSNNRLNGVKITFLYGK